MVDEMLEQTIDEGFEDTAEETHDWVIENDQDADWAISKIKKAQAEAERWRQYYGSMVQKSDERAARTESYFKARLMEYFGKVPHKETKTAEKYPLPSGDLILKKPKEVWNHDDVALLQWAKENGLYEVVKVKESIDWAGLKKRLIEDSAGVVWDCETGLACDAVSVTMTDPDFEVK